MTSAPLAGYTLFLMTANRQNADRQQQLYWAQMIELRVAATYIRRYRDYLGTWVRKLGVLKAIASSTSIAAWVIWRDLAFVWAVIIAASQVLDALKDVFPFAKQHKAASEHTIALESLFIDAQLEWEGIFSGRYTDDEIANRLHRLRKMQHDTARQSFPDGLDIKPAFFAQAEEDARAYFAVTYKIKWG